MVVRASLAVSLVIVKHAVICVPITTLIHPLAVLAPINKLTCVRMHMNEDSNSIEDRNPIMEVKANQTASKTVTQASMSVYQ